MIVHRRGRAAACAVLTLLTLCAQRVAPAPAQAASTSRGVKARGSMRKTQTPAPAVAGDARADAYIAEGDRHAGEGDWAGALKSYEQAVAVDPNHPQAHIYIGDAYMSLGKYLEAFAAYKEAVRVAPTNPEAHYSLGAAYNDMAMYGDAFKPFVRAIGLDPNYAEAHYGIGYAYLKQEQFKEAVVYLKRAVGIRNDFPDAHLSLGLAYLGLGQLKPAEQELKALEGMDASLAKDLEKELRKVSAPGADDSPARAPKLASQPQQQQQQQRGVGRQSAAPPPAQPAPDEPRPKGAAQARDTEIAIWDRIKNSDDPADFRGYLRTYPAGEFAGLARIRLRVLETRGGGPTISSAEQKPEATPPRTGAAEAGAAVVPAAPVQAAPARRGPRIEETLELLKSAFVNKLTYTATAPGQDADVVKVTYEVVIEYVPLSFNDCRIRWRDRKDTLSVTLSDLDPLSVKVEPRSRPNTTFSTPVWDVTVKTLDGAHAIRALKGDGSGTVNDYSDLDLQFGDKAKAERLARLLQQAIILCKSGS
jgi:tetratricopeptide (TPR) repeat protein